MNRSPYLLTSPLLVIAEVVPEGKVDVVESITTMLLCSL
jgi:hypothetical protein